MVGIFVYENDFYVRLEGMFKKKFKEGDFMYWTCQFEIKIQIIS